MAPLSSPLLCLLMALAAPFAQSQLVCDLVHTNQEYAIPSTDSCGWEIAPCPAGFRCVSGTCAEPVACSAGKFSTGSQASCKKCADGRYAPFPIMSACDICPAGTACDKAANNGVPEPDVCAPGYFSLQESSACTECTAGQFAPLNGSSTCIDCPLGHECTITNSTPCASGKYQDVAPATGNCKTCPVGHACAGTIGTPILCPSGTFSLGSATTCTQCQPGYACDNGNQTECLAGFYTSGSAFSACLECEQGRFSTSNRSTDCQICPAGVECNSTGIIGPCAYGHSSAGQGNCSTCDPGRFFSADGGVDGSVETCDTCPPGSFCSGDGNQTTCEPGTYAVGGQSECTNCAAGLFQQMNGSSHCDSCPGGFECLTTTADPVQCTPGTWSTNGSVAACLDCPAGYFCELSGTTAPVECARGTYAFPAAQSVCVDCPEGSACVDVGASPVACDSEDYSEEGDPVCHPCPEGSSCSGGVIQGVCPPGQFSNYGDTTCTACGDGRACPSSNETSFFSAGYPCPPGTVATIDGVTGAQDCVQCPRNFSCPTQLLNDAVACAAGTYSNPGAVTCSPCPGGFACSSLTGELTPCQPGEYSIAGNTTCTLCAAGEFCPSTSSLPVPCPEGTYSADGEFYSCQHCPPGFTCGGGELGNACPLGRIVNGSGSLSGSGGVGLHCVDCPAGYACPSSDPADAYACLEGYYSELGYNNCTICPAGFFCPNATTPAPIACDALRWSLEGHAQCYDCPAGYSCATQDAAPVECDEGTYSPFANLTCIECPAGQFCFPPRSDDPTNFSSPCHLGTVSVTGQTSCEQCGVGQFMNTTGQSECQNCSAGLFNSGGGATECRDCPAGYICPNAQPPSMCGRGQYNLAGPLGQSECVACDPGYYCTAGSTTANPTYDVCPYGFYCPSRDGRVQKFPCPAGKYGAITGAASEAEACADCPAGQYCLPATINHTWFDCPRGFYCPAGAAEPVVCPAGKYSQEMNLGGLGQCQSCPDGMFCLPGYEPRNCPVGYWCQQDNNASGTMIHGALTASTPGSCGRGFYSGDITGLSNNGPDECMACPPGSYCPGGLRADWPLPCPAGTYSNDTGLGSASECTTCPAGWSCPFVGRTWYNFPCWEGHYCPNGTAFPNENACPAGTYSESNHAENASFCETCPEFKACLVGTGGARGTPVNLYPSPLDDTTQNLTQGSGWLDCALGYYCPAGTRYPTEFACPAGTFSNSTHVSCSGLNGGGEYEPTCDYPCQQCPPGMYCDGSGLNGGGGTPNIVPDGDCDSGFYCPAGSSSPQQESCPLGTYSTATNLSHSEECLDCTVGHYCDSLALTVPLECDPGQFRNLTGQTNCTLCHKGYHCPISALVDELPCGVGFYTGRGATECTACTQGYYCPSNTTADDQQQECEAGVYCPEGTARKPDFEHDSCYPGYYCPSGSHSPTQAACPAGSYNPVYGLKQESDCVTCPAGYYCEVASTEPTGLCDPGHYCPAGSTTAQEVQCPLGTYNAFFGGDSVGACGECPAGYVCDLATVTPADCGAGMYCLNGTDSSEIQNCPRGTHSGADRVNLRMESECVFCPGGFSCGSGVDEPNNKCRVGQFCPEGISNSDDYGCTQGHYCPRQSSKPTPCPPGTFNNATFSERESDCQYCTPGSYCEGYGNILPDGVCAPGYYCPLGSVNINERTTPAGHFTLANASTPDDCLPGFFQPDSGQSTCLECTAGYYCPTNNVVSPPVCPQGSYCVAGVSTPVECPAGTYGASELVDALSFCTPCPAGFYCNGSTPAMPTGECLEGYFCPTGSVSPLGEMVVNATPGFPMEACAGVDPDLSERPCPAGHFCPNASEIATACPSGTYLPGLSGVAAEDCIPCDNGTFCEGQAQAGSAGQCDAGFYCHRNVLNVRPTDGLYTLEYAGTTVSAGGNICPSGSYCPTASVNPTECPAGKYSSSQGLADSSVCTVCSPGFFCPSGSSAVRGNLECPLGRYCPKETPGERDADGNPICPDCPRCPAGTYGYTTGLTTPEECTPCPGGSFCEEGATPALSGNCTAGRYCPAAAVSAVDGPLCPLGHYCPEGSAQPTPCPEGTFGNQTNQTQESDCRPCTAGYYCREEGLTAPSAPCAAGYYCTGSATTPYQHVSPTGTFTLDGASEPTNCSSPQFNAFVGQGACTTCPDRYECPRDAMTTPEACPAGSFCAGGVTSPCPEGKYSARVNLSTASECRLCPEGSACTQPGLSSPDATCEAGFFCAAGSVDTTGQTVFCDENATVSAPAGRGCDEGFYCPAGTDLPLPCPPGLYGGDSSVSNVHNLTSAEQCALCPEGRACAGYAVRGDQIVGCEPGYYCQAGCLSARPTEIYDSVQAFGFQHPSLVVDAVLHANGSVVVPAYNVTDVYLGGGLCPVGFFCPSNSTLPTVCPASTLGTDPGASSSESGCGPCPEGYFCPGNATANATSGAHGVDLALLRLDCPPGFYCEQNSSSPQACPAGTYGSLPNLVNSSQCVQCAGGRYCEAGASSIFGSGPCSAGYYCLGGAANSTPSDGGVTGNPCEDGFYCGEGSVEPQPCPGGQFCKGQPNVTLGNCSAGYYCDSASPTPTPVGVRDFDGRIVADVCWIGFFCPEASITPHACPAGTYNNDTGAPDESFCLPCDQGYYCPLAGNTSSQRQPCPAAFYCPAGTAEPYENSCPVGHYCEGLLVVDSEASALAAAAPAECPGGEYQDLPQQTSCKSCPAGYVCAPNGTVVPESCPAGHYCAAGSASGTPCPAGKFGNVTYLEECLACTPGWLCTTTGLLEPDVPCPQGFYCPSGLASLADDPVECPVGTYSNAAGLEVEAQCLHCPAGLYCDQIGLLEPVAACDGGYYCEDGSPTPVQNPCAAGTFCPAGSKLPQDCPQGHYCLERADAAIECAAGTFNPQLGSSRISACVACPIGHYCPAGSAYATPCGLGSYTLSEGNDQAADCTDCPPGSYCLQDDDATQVVDCIDGYYCPGGDYYPLFRCPAGHFCTNASSSPVPCEAGSYAPDSGASECSSCPSKFWCETGAVQLQPCLPGHACPAATASPVPCPVGTFTNRTDLATTDDCDVCVEGHYCPTEGLVHPIPCAAGHYCRSNSTIAAPTDCDHHAGSDIGDLGGSSTTFLNNCTGGTCVGGYFCPEGSIVPTGTGACEPGTYCPAGTAEVLVCAEGYYAPVEASSECSVCPSGHYCDNAVRAIACPETTYNPSEGANSSASCVACNSGTQCPEGSFETIPCTAGYYCPGGGEEITICPERHYCPEGAATPTNCSVEHFCPLGAVAETVCPPGSYCADDYDDPPETALGTAAPIPCPNGTYSPLPTDYYRADGSIRYGCLVCRGGFYCPEGSAGEQQCLEGFYCPRGSAEPIECPAGSTCPLGSRTPEVCEIGYYCPEGTGGNSILCPVGSYCPEASTEPTLCPAGTADADPDVRGSEADTCQLCEPGSAGSDPERAVCLPCEEGHVCSGPGTTTTTPVDLETELGYVCPAGHYCGASTALESPCPVGTFSEEVGAVSEDTCEPCEANHYNNRMGQTICHPCGATSTSNASAYTCECVGKNRVFQSATGECRCRGRFTDVNYGTQDGLSDCVPVAVPESCGEGQARDTYEQCVDLDDCSAECIRGGTRHPTGLCSCNVLQSPTDVCLDGTTDCLEQLPKYYLDKYGALHVTEDGVDLNITGDVEAYGFSSYAVAGNTYCPTTEGVDGHCSLEPVVLDLQRMSGMYVMTEGSTMCEMADRISDSITGYATLCEPAVLTSRRRRLQQFAEDFSDSEADGAGSAMERRELATTCTSRGGLSFSCPTGVDCDKLGDGVCDAEMNTFSCGYDAGDCSGIQNPILCKNVGDGVLFDMFPFARTAQNTPVVPVYDVNNTLNTNPDFDYSQFLELEEQADFCLDYGGEFGGRPYTDHCSNWTDLGVCNNGVLSTGLDIVRASDIYDLALEAAFNETTKYCCACGSGRRPLQPRFFAFTFDTPGTYVFMMQHNAQSKLVIHIVQPGEECAFGSGNLPIMTVRGDTLNAVGAADTQELAAKDAAKEVDVVFTTSVLGGVAVLFLVFLSVPLACYRCGIERHVWEPPEIEEGENPRGDIGDELQRDVLDQKRVGTDHLPPAPQELTADEIDQLMKHLEGLDVLSEIGFRQQRKVIDAALSTMQAESDTMRDMLARTIFSGSPLDKKIMLRKQVEAELDGREINKSRYATTLEDVLEAIDAMEKFLAKGVNFIASTTLDEFLDSFEGGAHHDFDRDDEITGRSQHFSDLMTKIETCVQGIGRCKSLFHLEKGRCMQTQALFDAARFAEILDPASELSDAIDSVFDAAASADIHKQELLTQLEPFASAIKDVYTEGTVVSDRFTEANFAAITEDANPAVFAATQKEFVVKYSRLLEQLAKLIDALHHGVPQVEERIHGHMKKQEQLVGVLKDSLGELQREIQGELDSNERTKQAKNRELGNNIAAMAMAMPVMKSLAFQARYHAAERKKLHEDLQKDQLALLGTMDRRLDSLAKEQLIDDVAAQMDTQQRKDAALGAADKLGDAGLKEAVLQSFASDKTKLEKLLELERQKRQEELHTRIGARKLVTEAQVLKRQQFEKQELEMLQGHEQELAKLDQQKDTSLLTQQMRLREEELRAVSAEEQKVARMQARLEKSLETSYQKKINELQRRHIGDCVLFFEIPASERERDLDKLSQRLADRARRKQEKISAEMVPQIQELEKQLTAGVKLGRALTDMQKLQLTQQKGALVASLEARIAAAKEESAAETTQVLAHQLRGDVNHFNSQLAGHSAKGRKLVASYQQRYDALLRELAAEKLNLVENLKAEAKKKKELVQRDIAKRLGELEATALTDHEYAKREAEKAHKQAASHLQAKLETAAADDWWWQDSLQDSIQSAKQNAAADMEAAGDGNNISGTPNALARQHSLINNLLGQKKAELRMLDDTLAGERAAGLEKIAAESEIELQRAKATNDKELAKRLKAAGGDPAEEQRIRDEIAADSQKQEMVQAATRRRKKALLQHQLREQKRKARLAAEKEISREREALEAGVRAKEFDLEMSTLQQAIAAGRIPVQKIAQAIEAALQPRHEKEVMALTLRQFDRKARRLNETVGATTASKQEAMAALLKSFEEEPGKFSAAEKAQRVQELAERFDEMQNRELALMQQEVRELERQEMFDLQMRQDDEIVRGYFRCAPDEMLEKYQQEAAKKRAAEIAEFKNTIMAEKQKRVARIQQQQALEQERLIETQQAEVAHLNGLYDDELSRMKMSLDEKLAARSEQMKRDRQRQLEDQIRRYELQQQARQQAGGQEDVDVEATVDRLRANFEKDTDRIVKSMEMEKRRQEHAMEQKLHERRERQLRFKNQALLDQMKDIDAAGRAKVAAVESSAEDVVVEKLNQVNTLGQRISQTYQERRAAGTLATAAKVNLWGRKLRQKASKRSMKAAGDSPSLASLSPEERRKARLQAQGVQRAKHHVDTMGRTNAAAADRLLNGSGSNDPKYALKKRKGRAFKKAFGGANAGKKRDPIETLGDLNKVKSKLATIESLLKSIVTRDHGSGAAASAGGLPGSGSSGGYLDTKDLFYKTEGVLKPAVNPEADAKVAARLSFAHAIADRCGLHVIGSKQAQSSSSSSSSSSKSSSSKSRLSVRLVLAEKLPHNTHDGNAYRNSVSFDDTSRTLYLRLARFQENSSGDLMVYLVHCFSHVLAGDLMGSDAGAEFLGHLHNSLRQCGKLISALSRNAQDFAAAERAADGSALGEVDVDHAPQLSTKMATVNELMSRQKPRGSGDKRAVRPIAKGALGRKRQLAEELDGAEAAYLQDLVTVREYGRAMDKLEQELKQPAVADDIVQYSMLQGRLNQLRVKYDNAQADAQTSRAHAEDLQRAVRECPPDNVLAAQPGAMAAYATRQRETQRALTMAANAVAGLSEYLTPR